MNIPRRMVTSVRFYAATVSGSRTGTRSRSFGATCSMNSRIERTTFSGVAHFLPVDDQQRAESAGSVVEFGELLRHRIRIAEMVDASFGQLVERHRRRS